LAEDGEKSALDALAALSLYSRESVRSQIQETLAKRKSPALQRAFEKDFG
jgi:hypothetical protein